MVMLFCVHYHRAMNLGITQCCFRKWSHVGFQTRQPRINCEQSKAETEEEEEEGGCLTTAGVYLSFFFYQDTVLASCFCCVEIKRNTRYRQSPDFVLR